MNNIMMRNQENGYGQRYLYKKRRNKIMFDPRNYRIMIIKKDNKEPVRLEKKDEPIYGIHQKLNIVIIILLFLLFLILCFILVPPTYGFFRY